MSDTTQPHYGGRPPPVRALHRSRADRVSDAIVRVLARAGIGPFQLLTTRGRKSGRAHTIPVVLVEQDGRSWLVAPYGAVEWVHNARTAGWVTVRRGRHTGANAVREVTADEPGSILKRYVGIAKATRPYFQARTDSPVEDFIAEAHRHPVFELTPVA